MIRRVLVATDLSAAADRAMERAQHLAIELGAELLCVSAIEPVEGRQSFDLAERQELIRRHFQATALGSHCKPQVGVSVGPAEEAILHFLDLWQPDLTVVGDRYDGTGGGRTLDAIIRMTGVPLLVVRNRALGPYGRVQGTPSHTGNAVVEALVRPSAPPGRNVQLLVIERKQWHERGRAGIADTLVVPT